MTTFSLVAHGFRTARKHPRLVLIVWLAPLVPALILISMVASNLVPSLSHSLFSQGIFEGSVFPIYAEFRSSPADSLDPILSRGVVIMTFLTLLIQVFMSAGIVEVLAGPGRPHPFLTGVRQNTARFLRSGFFFLVAAIPAAVAAGLTIKGSSHLAKHFADGRWDLAGFAAATVVFLAFFAPATLAYDLSRIASVNYDHRSMFRGLLRALAVVLKNPRVYIPLFMAFLALPLVIYGIYSAIRQPWTPSSALAVVLLALMHQVVMGARAFIKIGFWAAEVEVYKKLDEPDLCRAKQNAPIEYREPEVTISPMETPDVDFTTADPILEPSRIHRPGRRTATDGPLFQCTSALTS